VVLKKLPPILSKYLFPKCSIFAAKQKYIDVLKRENKIHDLKSKRFLSYLCAKRFKTAKRLLPVASSQQPAAFSPVISPTQKALFLKP
jgi:hypothetical protein